MKPPCIHCGQPLLEYRGSWFGPGDDSYCPNGKTRHEPAPAVDPRNDTIAKLREDKATLARVLDETVGDVKALRAELIKARKDCARLQEEKRLRAQASIGRTWTAQIERGDDRNGADTALVKPAITGRLVTVGQITTCDNDCADSGDYNFTTMSGALIVMDDDSARAAAGLFGKVIEIRGVG